MLFWKIYRQLYEDRLSLELFSFCHFGKPPHFKLDGDISGNWHVCLSFSGRVSVCVYVTVCAGMYASCWLK